MIELRDVHKKFGSVEVLKGITASVEKSEVVCIIGPSGSGKSTILRCINGLRAMTPATFWLRARGSIAGQNRSLQSAPRYRWCSSASICFRTGRRSKTSSKGRSM
jgi:ABC-type polar amino acid transport system ATPase subunit